MIPYDAAGRLIGSKDPLGGRTAYAYDALGNLSRVSENGNGAEYFYDPAGNLIGMKDAEGRSRRQESMDAYLAYISRTGSTLIGKS